MKNNLQVISSLLYLQGRRIDRKPSQDSLNDCRSRVQSIALIHEKIYRSESLASIDFGPYLEDLSRQVANAIGAQVRRAKVRVQSDRVLLDIECAIPCALIVNELLSNAMKHAFPDAREGDILVSLSQVAPGWLQLVVSDTGVGFPADFDFGTTTTLGLELVFSLVRQLRGTIDITSHDGARVQIRFPWTPRRVAVAGAAGCPSA